MALAKVWNENFLPFSQKFEDEVISIQPNHFIVMDMEKAHQFMSRYYPIKKDTAGVQDPSSYKKLKLEPIGEDEKKAVNDLKCNGCAFYGKDKKDLDAHITEKHLYQLADADERKKRGAQV